MLVQISARAVLVLSVCGSSQNSFVMSFLFLELGWVYVFYVTSSLSLEAGWGCVVYVVVRELEVKALFWICPLSVNWSQVLWWVCMERMEGDYSIPWLV